MKWNFTSTTIKLSIFFEIIPLENSARPKSRLSKRWTNGWNFGETGEQKIKANKKRLTTKKKGNGGKEIEKKGRKTGKKYGSVSDR